MTHSGGKPHAVGDKGQRYEVRATDYPNAGRNVIGWTDKKEGAERMSTAILTAPGCSASEVIDREFEQWKVKVAAELSRMTFNIDGERIDGEQYIKDTGDDCWREMFDDGLSPTEAANEETLAAHDR